MESYDHDDFFDDDDLDDIPDNAYNELERNAYLSTQQPPPLLTGTNGQVRPPTRPDLHRRSSSDYGFEDEADDGGDVIDLNAKSAYTALHQSEQFGQSPPNTRVTNYRGHASAFPNQLQTYGNPSGNISDNVQRNSRPAATSSSAVQSPNEVSEPPINRINPSEAFNSHEHTVGGIEESDCDVTALQARILELEQERNGLRQRAESANNAAVSRAGEIAIVRANHDKASKEYERRLAVMQKLHTEELARQKAELELAKKEREKVETNNKFLEHDLAQEAEKARNARKSLKDGAGNITKLGKPGTPLSTPKKTKSMPFRDGFDDDEVMFVSPSKSKERSKSSTPKVGAKRKRNVNEDSPVQPLPLSELEGLTTQLETTTQSGFKSSNAVQPDPHKAKMFFMRDVLNHCRSFRDQRTVEVLSTISFPSEPKKTVSSLVHDSLNILWSDQSLEECRLQFCHELMSLWSRCLEEKFHVPLYDLSELLQYILVVSPSGLSRSCVPRLVPLCLATADIIAIPTAKAFKNPSSVDAPSIQTKSLIDPLDYLALLDLCILNCASLDEPLTAFWTAMEYDFVLVMLHKAQPLAQISSMLALLTTSTLNCSFGAISANAPQQQQKHESDTIDRLTNLLFETPETPADEDPYTAAEILQLRNNILILFKALCSTQYGGNLLATHRLAIGRLVRLLHESVVAMYTYVEATHDLTTQLVNTSVHILAHLTACHPDVVDMRSRLAAVPGGAHKHLVALSRVAFADGISVVEAGIDGEAAEAAHRMLDEWLSPEEGEAVVSVFSSGR